MNDTRLEKSHFCACIKKYDLESRMFAALRKNIVRSNAQYHSYDTSISNVRRIYEAN